MTASIWTPGSNSVPQVDPLNQIKGEEFVATAGQTDFVITQFTYAIGGNALTVYVNATKVPASELTELSTTSFRIPACEAGDIVEVVGNTATADAGGAAIAAAASAAAALASELAAAASAAAASSSASSASSSASNASTSESNASTSASASAASAAAALVSENNAELAETNAETALAAVTALVQGTEQAPASVGTSDVYTMSITGYNCIDIVIAGLSAVATWQLGLRLGDSGGTESSGYTDWSLSETTGATPAVSRSSFELFAGLSCVNTDTISGTIKLRRIAGNLWSIDWSIQYFAAAENCVVGSGYKTLSSALTSVTLLTLIPFNAAFDAGTVAYRAYN